MSSNRKIITKPAVAALVLAGVAIGGATGGLALADVKANLEGEAPSIKAPVAAAVTGAGKHASLADMVEAVGPSVVQIQVTSEPRMERMASPFDSFGSPGQPGQSQPRGALGSGFIVSASGLIITNNHVVDGADTVTVQLSDGREFRGRVLGTDPKTDLAVVRVNANAPLPAVRWGDSDRTRVGDSVFAVGSPFGLGNTVTAGIISARGREIGAGPYDDFLQVDAAINSGNSGGPLFDASGRVIGVNTAIFSPSGGNVGIGFAIPAQLAQKVARDIARDGHVQRGRIGVALQQLTPEIASSLGLREAKGALIAEVEYGGPADASGIRGGDVVRSFAGKPVDDSRHFARMVADTRSGSSVPVTVIREGRAITGTLRIGAEQPA